MIQVNYFYSLHVSLAVMLGTKPIRQGELPTWDLLLLISERGAISA